MSAAMISKGLPTNLVISQIYGAGGNTGATYNSDFIEIFNPTAAPIVATNWSVQYASATGSTWQVTAFTGTIPAGGYFLIKEGGGANGIALPTVDATGTIAMAAAAGKVALVSNITALTGACPTGGAIVDFAGFGTTANCFEGAGPTPAPSTTNAAKRASNGCSDTDINSADFSASAVSPRNSASPVNVCTPPPTKLAITLINPASPTQNTSFAVTVQAQDATNTPRNVVANTNVSLTLLTGTGALSGILTGTITAGTNNVIITGVLYNVAEANVSLTATRTTGDVLTAGNSATFTVQAPVSPVIAISGTLTPFNTTALIPSASQSYTVTGSSLQGDILITPPANFKIRTGVNAFSNSPLTLTQTAGAVPTTTIDVIFDPLVAGPSSGMITHTSLNATQQDVNVSGNALEVEPTIQPAVTIGTVTSYSMVVNFSGGNGSNRIVVVSPVTVTTYTPTDGFESFTGVSSNFSSASSVGSGSRIVYRGNLNTVTVTGLDPNTTYHATVFEYNGTTTTANYLTTSPGTNNATTLARVLVPVPMSSLSFTENFNDEANWGNGFNGGTGAQHWDAVAINATGAIPDGIKTTVSTATFTNTSTSGGLQRGSLAASGSANVPGTLVLLSTGATNNSSACAIDFFMDFTGTVAGTLSFDWAVVINGGAPTDNREGSLRVYGSTDGITFTELPSAAVLNKVNNVAASGSITTVALPVSFNNSPTARLRFYEYNASSTGSSGNRPKISIDNVVVTATLPSLPDHLAISNISPASPALNGTFSVTVQAQTPSNVASNVIANTDVTLQYTGGTGVLSGTLSGTITAGTNSITFTGLSYNVAETFTLTAHRTLGDVLADGSSSVTILAPVITLTGTLSTFVTGVGTPSASQTYTVSGANLTAGIVLTPPQPFEISTDGFAWVDYTSSITLPQTAGTVPTTTIYVHYNPIVAGPNSGNISHTSTGATTQNEAVLGTTTIPEPTINSTITFGCNTGTSMIINFTGGNGSSRIVVMKAAGSVSYIPTDGSAATGVSSDFSIAADQGSGDRIVFDGSGSTVTVSGLNPATSYAIAIYEYNGSGATADYLTTPATATGGTTGGISYSSTGGTYTQNFDGLPNTGTFNTNGFGSGPFYLSECPVGANNLAGWQYGRIGGTGSDVKFNFNDGSSTSGAVYSYGATNAIERSLGSLSTGTTINNMGLVLTNNTSDILTSVTITYTGEQWRNGGGTGVPNTLVFSYSLNGTGILSGTYTTVPALDFTSPTVSTTAATLNGNLPANQVAKSATFTLSGNWAPGQKLVLRWDDPNDPSNDHGLAIDDFTFTAITASVPVAQDHDISFSSVGTTSMTANWINGDGQNRIVVMNTTNSFTNPSNGSTYSANTVYTGTGYGAPGEQVVYNGTGTSVPVTGLSPNTQYWFRVYNYNASGAQSTYLTSTATLNPNSQFSASLNPPDHLAIISVNGGVGVDVVKNQPFSVVVQAQDATNVPQAVTTTTGVSLSVAIGSGTLTSGNIIGSITAGQNSTTITGVIYDLADLGVSLQADQTSGTPVLAFGTSASFNVVEPASALVFDTLPPYGVVNTAVGQIRVKAIRPDLSVDQYFTGPITISVTTGAGTITGNVVNAVAGIATFNSAVFNSTGPYTLTATSGAITSPVSNIIYITNPPVLNELVVPQFIAAKTTFVASPGTSTNVDRTPIAVCLQFDNLAPNTSFDLRIGVDSTTGPSTSFGGSNIWTGAAFTGNIITNAFTTDANGSSPAKWIYIQPATSRFEPGMIHNLRVAYVKNGLVMPTSPILSGIKTITSLDVQSTARTASTADDGAFLKGSSPLCIGSKYILFYDNTAGTGQPLYSYQARQMDATNTQQSGLPVSIDDVFRQAGTSAVGDYAGVIPSNNPNGVQRIEVRNPDNTILNYVTDADGVWGTVNTVNPVRRSVATLLSSDAPLSTVQISGITSTPETCVGLDGTATVTAVSAPNANPAGTLSYAWSPSAQTTNPATALMSSAYTVTVTNSTGGCTATASVTVGAPTMATVTAQGPTTFCAPGSVVLAAGNGGVSWIWSKDNVSTGIFTQSITVTTTGTYTVTADDGTGCQLTSAPVVVTVNSFGYSGTIYSESMGTPTGTTSLSSWAGWQNTAPVTYTSTSPSPTDVRITNASTGYPGVSGSGNIFFTTSGVRNFIISGINTLGYSGITFTFGLRRDAGTAAVDPFVVEYSTDGNTFAPLTITQPPTTGAWVLISPVGAIPATANLRLKFSKSTSTGSFRLDDVKLTGATTTVDVAASGTTNLCPGSSVRLTSNIPVSNPPTNVWSNTLTTKSILVTTAGTYSVTVTDINGCTSASAQVVVNTLIVDDGNACTTDACNSITGVVTNTPVIIDDLNACTTDACNTTTGTITHTAVIVDDNNACTTDACNTSTGSITNTPVSVDDFNACTNDACDTFSGSISHDAINIDDNDPCTADACDSGTGSITHTNICSGPTFFAKILLEGYYTLGSLPAEMNNSGTGGCLFITGLSIDPTHADSIDISAMDATTYLMVDSQRVLLKTDGSTQVTFGVNVLPNTGYFIKINHRNSLETWSGAPIILSATTALAPYDFTTSASQAYGNNLSEVDPGVFAIYGGDISDAGNGVGFQDDIIESQDYGDMENAVYVTSVGYNPEDITGDGLVESADYGLMENNVYFTRVLMRP